GARAEVRRELGLPETTQLVLMVGRLSTDKNYSMFIRAARRVCERRAETVFLAAGHGPLQQVLEEEVRQTGMDSRFRFLGLRRDVPRLLAACDVFCLASDSEGFPNAVLEAMAAG